eukprot:scaffold30054_cov32-Tisochrysis_lutea.AAC.1
MDASAIVPGPAFVTMQSAAAMNSDIRETNPSTCTCRLLGHSWSRSWRWRRWFRPHTTTICIGCALSPSLSPIAWTMAPSFPTPSPPPTINTVFRSGMRPSSRLAPAPRRFCRVKSWRTGRP